MELRAPGDQVTVYGVIRSRRMRARGAKLVLRVKHEGPAMHEGERRLWEMQPSNAKATSSAARTLEFENSG